MPELPPVSIVSPTFNSARYVEELFQSVARDYPRIEPIVIDDGSMDGGVTVALRQRRTARGRPATLKNSCGDLLPVRACRFIL
jgi:glycosyltransferase involved in cell wall biosynthesis